jgi:hypothetical protein
MARTVGSLDPATINNASSWEFYAGGSGSNASWTAAIASAKPLFVWPGRTGVVTLSYHSTIQKFIMVVSTPTNGTNTTGFFGTHWPFVAVRACCNPILCVWLWGGTAVIWRCLPYLPVLVVVQTLIS